MIIDVANLGLHLIADLTLSHDWRVTWLYGCSQLNLSHNLLKLVAIVLEKVQIKLFFKKPHDHMIMGHVTQWVRYPQPKSQGFSKSNRTQ